MFMMFYIIVYLCASWWHFIFVLSDKWVNNAESGPGEDTVVCNEHGDEEELHPGHPHLTDREITWPENPPSCCQNSRRVGEKQLSNGCQPGNQFLFFLGFFLFYSYRHNWPAVLKISFIQRAESVKLDCNFRTITVNWPRNQNELFLICFF